MTLRPTPYLRADVDRVRANVDAMATHARDHGLALRPHAKTHKAPDVAALQLAAGAVGLTVATVAEAEVFADHGCDDLVIAYPLWVDDSNVDRLRALAGRVRIAIGVESVEGARNTAARLGGSGVEVLVEVDAGHHRTGIRPDEAGAVARACAGLHVRGVFTFPGHAYAPEGRAAAAEDERHALAVARDALHEAGIGCEVVSGGSTPSVAYADEVVTEVRPGAYVYGDAQQVELGIVGADRVALSAWSTVVHARPGHVVVDAGSKACGADRPAYAPGHGHLLDRPEVVVVAQSEHHATLAWPLDAPLPALGTRLAIVPNHVCNAVVLADEIVVTQAGTEVGTWSVAARADGPHG